MTTISATQEDILELANSREDGMVLPFPDDMKLKGGAAQKVLASLINKGFIKKAEDEGFVITNNGREAIDADLKEDELETEGPAEEEAEKPQIKKKSVSADKTGKTPKGKLGDMFALLKRPEGATVTALMESTGWQKHSVRGAISGQLKTKYGFKIEQIATENEETVYQIAD